jgi:hypothetical protein
MADSEPVRETPGEPPRRMGRDAALAWAADVRAVRSDVLDAVEAGRLDLTGVLERARTEPLVAMIHVLDVVEALPGWGKVVCRRTLDGLGIAHHSPVIDVEPAVLRRAFAQAPA